MCNRAACVTNMEQENMEPEIKDLEIMEGEIVEEEKDPTLQFIEAVKEHKCIWDMQSEEYYNKEMYREAWKSLIPPSEYPMPEKLPDDSQQEADIKEKGRSKTNTKCCPTLNKQFCFVRCRYSYTSQQMYQIFPINLECRCVAVGICAYLLSEQK